jgi:hypothetical protein
MDDRFGYVGYDLHNWGPPRMMLVADSDIDPRSIRPGHITYISDPDLLRPFFVYCASRMLSQPNQYRDRMLGFDG